MNDYAGHTDAALRALCAGATPGPWRACHLKGFGAMRFVVSESQESQPQWHQIVCILENDGGFAGGEFIAAARLALPAALDRVAALEAENARLARRCRAMEWALARGVELMPIDLLAQWDGVRQAQEWDGEEDG